MIDDRIFVAYFWGRVASRSSFGKGNLSRRHKGAEPKFRRPTSRHLTVLLCSSVEEQRFDEHHSAGCDGCRAFVVSSGAPHPSAHMASPHLVPALRRYHTVFARVERRHFDGAWKAVRVPDFKVHAVPHPVGDGFVPLVEQGDLKRKAAISVVGDDQLLGKAEQAQLDFVQGDGVVETNHSIGIDIHLLPLYV